LFIIKDNRTTFSWGTNDSCYVYNYTITLLASITNLKGTFNLNKTFYLEMLQNSNCASSSNSIIITPTEIISGGIAYY